uniref:MFS transporter n=1 Tax=Gongylonema pulchrum TaxID=637853 RepID=A0A183EC91_9BILA
LGISQIGFVMTSFGVTDAICSLVFGPLIKLFGRMPLFVFGAVINMLMIMTLLIWPLNPGDTSLFYAIAGVLGMADGVWNTQINGFWVTLSGTSLETAFANYRFWESAGFSFGLLLTRFTIVSQFLHISLGMLLAGMLCYLSIEFYDDICVRLLKRLLLRSSRRSEPLN